MKRKATVLLAAAIALAALTAARDRAPDVARVSADASETGTRVIVTFPTRRASCDVTTIPEGIRLACRDKVPFEPAAREVGDGRIASWRTLDDGALLFAPGPAFDRFDAFDLKNPARVVIDFEGRRSVPAREVASPAARSAAARVPAPPERVVVIDPGHGGVETGAIGPAGLQEKDLTLDLARRLADLLRKQGMTPILTRDDDRLVPLDDRTATANHNRAELFVSIHLNASKAKKAFGAETYFLSPDATDDEARTLAALENKAYAGGVGSASATAAVERGDIGRGLELILWDLAQNEYLAESGRLAETVQREMNALTGTRDRGVRQAPFRVLMGATMPAILVEVGFVSNAEEEQRLGDEGYRDKIAEALARALAAFRSGAPTAGSEP